MLPARSTTASHAGPMANPAPCDAEALALALSLWASQTSTRSTLVRGQCLEDSGGEQGRGGRSGYCGTIYVGVE